MCGTQQVSLGTCQALGEAPDFHDPAVSRDTSHFTVEPMEASERLRHGPKAASGHVGQLQSQRPFLKGATLLLEKGGIRRALREGKQWRLPHLVQVLVWLEWGGAAAASP